LNGGSNVYLSPELVNYIASKNYSPEYNVYKADVYSLGVTFLYVTLLEDPLTSVYDYAHNKVNHERIDALLS